MEKICSFLTFCFAILFSLSSSAQALCETTQSLTINTGYNPLTNTVIAAGQPDPNWNVTALTPLLQATPGVVTPPANAIVINKHNLWASGSNSNYISCLNTNRYFTASSPNPNDTGYQMTVTRKFRVCKTDNFTFNLNLLADNRIMSLNIDNGASQMAPQANGVNFSPANNLTFNQALAPGTHTLNIVLQNSRETVDDPFNYFGLNVYGTITGTQSSLVSVTADSNCLCVPPPPTCVDSCYWTVNGNTINNGYNILGTTNNADIRIHSNNLQRGVIKADGKFGWNTTAPTALLHINCANPIQVPSNLRFENLPTGNGTNLVVDANGYVLKSGRVFGLEKVEAELAELKTEYMALAAELKALKASSGRSGTDYTLAQNTPNPFTNTTVISYSMPKESGAAVLLVTDMAGKELQRHRLGNSKSGTLTLNAGTLPNGLYLYSLIVNGEEKSTRKMVIAR